MSDRNGELEIDRAWWKEALVYQIYPVSFFDSNGDGIGDLNGIALKLDYLKDLGVDILWLSPIYKSPLADMGYDISDYRDIDPRYGTLQDWDNLLKAVHDRGMKLMMDLVVNHTSDEHSWFTQSRSSKSDPKRDWYIWRPPKYDCHGNRQPPNNWKAVFQGSAWEYDEQSQEYYLHLYLTKQPDLNWENPEVREAVWDMMKFWLERGCDGFRVRILPSQVSLYYLGIILTISWHCFTQMDVINIISKIDGLPDAPITVPDEELQPASTLFANGPRVHEFVKEMNSKVLSKYNIITVGETPFTHDPSQLAAYVLPANQELNMVFQFELMEIDTPLQGEQDVPLLIKPWSLAELKSITGHWQNYKRDEGFWNAVFTENHDHARAVSRFGDDSDEWRTLSAKMLAMLQVTQGGTQFVFQGQELGLKNFPRAWGIEEYKDVASKNFWNKTLVERQARLGPGEVPGMEDVLDNFSKKARDHARVPMQWDSTPNAGFTSGTPWMRVNEDYVTWNAESQLRDRDSVLAFWTRLIHFRKNEITLIYGDFNDVSEGHDKVFAFTRQLGSSWLFIMLNFGKDGVEFVPKTSTPRNWASLELIMGNYPEGKISSFEEYTGKIYARGYEAALYRSTLDSKN
ncbi:alpha amylase [Coprinopsis marcescibilis]|uniref:Alpha amylase n=1 Tax=Coprinopsis marcescibilis TaxID=230819 RepID=A0A5C3KT87_COPMA|nr:alpha amylase [Coprinopsis marcescibilis]